MAAKLVGVSEETTTGVKRLYEMTAAGTLLFPVRAAAPFCCVSVRVTRLLPLAPCSPLWATLAGP